MSLVLHRGFISRLAPMMARYWKGMGSRWLFALAIASLCHPPSILPASAHGGEDHGRPASAMEATQPQSEPSRIAVNEAALVPQPGEIQLPEPPVLGISQPAQPAIATETPKSWPLLLGELIFIVMLATPVGLMLWRDRAQMSRSERF